jgi:drug/metabolite transporter (DMT)-like permease
VAAAVAATVLIWGSAFVAIRTAAPAVGAATLVSTRLILGAAVFALLARRLGVRRPSRRHLPLLAAIAATGLVGYQLLLSAGESRTPAGVSAMIFATAPVLVVLLARLTLGERLDRVRWIGVVVAVVGAAIIAATQGLTGSGTLGGALLVLAAVCCYAPWMILSKKAVRVISSHDVAAWSTWLAALICAPLSFGALGDLSHADVSAVGATVYLGVVVTSAPLLLWSWVLSRVPASVASSSLLLIGPSALVTSWLVLGESPAAAALAGGALTLCGVVLTQFGAPRARRLSRVTTAHHVGVHRSQDTQRATHRKDERWPSASRPSGSRLRERSRPTSTS